MFSNDLSQVAPSKSLQPVQHASLERRQLTSINAWSLSVVLARLDLLPAMITPVLWAAALAWWHAGQADKVLLGFSILANGAAFVCLYLLTSHQDFKRSLESPGAAPGLFSNLVSDGLSVLRQRIVRPGTVRSMGYIAFTLSAMATVWLGYLVGWPMLFFGWLELLFIYTYAMPPVSLGYRGWGLGEVVLLISVGLLPALSTYYAQTQALDPFTVGSMLPVAALAFLAAFAPSYATWQRDWKLRKNTLVVVLGPERALLLGVILAILAFAALILMVAIGNLPTWSLFALLGLPPLLRAFSKSFQEPFNRVACVLLDEAAVHGTLVTSALLILSLWIDK